MNISGIDFDLNNYALCIYLSGCDGACKGCHNPELWDFNAGKEWVLWKQKLKQYLTSEIVRYCWVLGGEPLLNNNNELEQLIIAVSCFREVMIWTRFELEDIPKNIIQYCSYVKTGKYDCNSESYNEPLFGIELASLNQKIIKV